MHNVHSSLRRLIAALPVLSVVPLSAQSVRDFRTATPAEAGFSAAALQATMDSVRAWVERDRIVGAVLLVVRNGAIVLHEAAGSADRERGIPMRTDHILRMRSMTKPLVGAAVLALRDEGRFELQDRVSRFLPSFDNPRSREITIFQLLTHTSGIRGAIYGVGEGTSYATLREAVDSVGRIGPETPPGTDYWYSDPGTSTLGALIAEVSGMPAEDFIDRRILQPLGMSSSFLLYDRSDPRAERVASTYRHEGTQAWTRYWDNTQPQVMPFFRASGGLYSTAIDYARFLDAMLNAGASGSPTVLSEASVREATQPHSAYVFPLEERRERQRFYGMHWTVYTDRYRPVDPPFAAGIFEHAGSDGTTGWVDPSRGLIIVYLTQSRGNDTRMDLVRLVYSAMADARAVPDRGGGTDLADPGIRRHLWSSTSPSTVDRKRRFRGANHAPQNRT